jgi:hypothetical protein
MDTECGLEADGNLRSLVDLQLSWHGASGRRGVGSKRENNHALAGAAGYQKSGVVLGVLGKKVDQVWQ